MAEMKLKVINKKENQPTLEEAQEFVGGWVERILLKNGDIMLIDEEGKLKQNSINPKATDHWIKSYGITDVIVGNAILIKQSALTDLW
jgi:hypothetical protein